MCRFLVLNTMVYFAYGSNMLRQRVLARGLVLRGDGQPASAEGYRLVFNKRSIDGSSKANLMGESGAISWGVLFQVGVESLLRLDEAEAVPSHYRREVLFVRTAGARLAAVTYLAQPDKILAEPDRPWDWYLALMLAGARSAPGMPSEWINHLRSVGGCKKSHSSTTRANEAIAQLKAAGHPDWQDLLVDGP